MAPKILTRMFPFHAAAFQVAYTSMCEMLNATSSDQQSRLIKQWRESTLSQLSHVGLIVSAIEICFDEFRSRTMSDLFRAQ